MQKTHYNYPTLLILIILVFFSQNKSYAQFTTNGTAIQSNANCYRLTANTTTQQGSIYDPTPVDFSSDFAVSGSMNFGNNDGGADGITFILTNSTSALGTGGGDIGYGGIFTSVVIEFDTWQNTEKGDPVQDHMGITSAGQSSHTGITALSAPVTLPNLEDGQDHCFTINWSAASQTLSATIDGFNTVSYSGNIPTLFFNSIPNVYYGFTASTGGASNEHNICFDAPSVTPMQDQEICQGESVQLQADPSGSWYNWTPNPTLSSFNVSNPTATPTTTTLYDVTIGFDCGSPVMDDVLVTVIPAPTAVAQSNSPLCLGATLELNAIGTGTYSWTGPDGFSSNLQNPTIPNITTANAGDYTVEIEGPNGCEGSATVPVIVLPSSVIIVPQPPLCQNETQVQLSAIPSGGTWGGVADADGIIYPNLLGSGIHTVTYSGIGTGGCQGMDEIMIEILSAGIIEITSPTVFCTTSTSETLTATPAGGIWSGEANSTGEINPQLLGEGTYSVTYTVGDANCSSDMTFTIEVTEQETISIMTDSPYCANTGVQTLTAGEPGGVWGGVANAAGEINPSLLGTGTFEVTYTTSGSCPGMGQTFIDINSIPTANLGQGGNFCPGEDFPLEITLTGSSPINVSYTIDDIPQADLSLNAGTTTINVTTPGIYEISTITDANDCEGTSSNSIEIIEVDAPQLVSLVANCDATQTEYQVTFEISGGDPTTYMVSSIIGGSISTTAPYIFTSDPIPSDDNYTFLVSDINQCETLELTGSFTCQCLATTGIDNAAICEGESILLAGEMQTTNGMYIDTLVNFNGCDSILTTTLTILETDTIFLADAFTCNPSGVGLFMDSYINEAGCDSTEIVNVLLSPSQTYNIASETCNPNEEGVFTNEYTTTDGCDSIVIETVTLLQSDTIYLPDTFTCDPDNVGTFSDSFTNQFGCDSTEIVNVILSNSQTYNIASETCNPNEEGVFTNEYTTTDGCDSIVIETVTLLQSDTIYLPDTFTCAPDNVGTFSDSFTNQFGCDSTEIVNVILSNSQTYNIASETCNPNEEGVFTNEYTTTDGCDSIVIETVTLLQSDTIYLPDTFTCDPSNVGTFSDSFTNQFGCDSTEIVNVILSNSQTYNIASETCNPNEEGVFTNEYTTTDGCDSIVIETVTLLQSDTIYLPDTFTCDPDNVGTFSDSFTNQFGCDSTEIVTINLAPSDLINVPLTTCNPDEVGEVTMMFTNQFGCDSIIIETTTLLDISDCGINSTVVGSTISCEENTGSFTINIEFGQGPFDISWTGAENGMGMIESVGENINFTNLSAGTYEIMITAANGFSTNLTTEILQNIPPDVTAFITSDYNSFDVSCLGENDGTAQVEVTNGQAPYAYFWSNGETSSAVENLAAGNYSITVTDALACENETEIILISPEEISLIFEVSDLDCFGQSSGTIVADVTGGVPPYSFVLNNNDAQESNIFTGLTDGVFTISVEDANGCKISEVIGINAPLEVNVDLGLDLNIDLGDNTGLTALTDIDALLIDSVSWTGIDSTECPECLTQFVAPLFTTTYSVNITAENGCEGSDDLTIFVDRDKQIYVPTAFSPESDLNNLVMIFAGDDTVTNIKEFRIVNRWGNMLFEGFNFLPNDPTFGWNGNFKEQPMNTGVYVWYAVVEFIDGETEVFKGDVTLIR